MPEGNSAVIERIIANTINETARGDPDTLAARIVAAWPKQAIVSFRPTGERTPHHASRGQSRDSSIGAQTGIAGSLRAIPRPARPLSGTRRTPRLKLPRFRGVELDLGDHGSVVTASIAAS